MGSHPEEQGRGGPRFEPRHPGTPGRRGREGVGACAGRATGGALLGSICAAERGALLRIWCQISGGELHEGVDGPFGGLTFFNTATPQEPLDGTHSMEHDFKRGGGGGNANERMRLLKKRCQNALSEPDPTAHPLFGHVSAGTQPGSTKTLQGTRPLNSPHSCYKRQHAFWHGHKTIPAS